MYAFGQKIRASCFGLIFMHWTNWPIFGFNSQRNTVALCASSSCKCKSSKLNNWMILRPKDEGKKQYKHLESGRSDDDHCSPLPLNLLKHVYSFNEFYCDHQGPGPWLWKELKQNNCAWPWQCVELKTVSINAAAAARPLFPDWLALELSTGLRVTS